MTPAVLAAVLVAMMTSIIAFLVPRRVRPHVAAKVITLLAVAAALATFWALLMTAGNSIVQLHGIAERLSWCSGLVATHHDTLTPAGALAILGLIGSGWSVGRVHRAHRRLRAPAANGPLVVIESEEPTAFAIPGRPGRVVVSSSMLRTLDDAERRALLAHERAHLRCAHHRYLRLTQLASATVPPLRLLNSRVRFFTERWADEEAATEVGDRTVVASAIARAALARTRSPAGALGISDADVLERVQSMLSDPPHRAVALELGFASLALLSLGALGFSVILIEPWVASLLGLCN